jgi:hypothetical protein
MSSYLYVVCGRVGEDQIVFAYIVVVAQNEDDAYSFGHRRGQDKRLIGQVAEMQVLNDFILSFSDLSILASAENIRTRWQPVDIEYS